MENKRVREKEMEWLKESESEREREIASLTKVDKKQRKTQQRKKIKKCSELNLMQMKLLNHKWKREFEGGMYILITGVKTVVVNVANVDLNGGVVLGADDPVKEQGRKSEKIRSFHFIF